MRVLIVEDDSERLKFFRQELIGHNLVCVASASEAISELKNNIYDLMFLDHDLNQPHYSNYCFEGTGSEVSKYLQDNYQKNPDLFIVLHSLNPVGVRKMSEYLNNRNFSVINFLALKSKGISRFINLND